MGGSIHTMPGKCTASTELKARQRRLPFVLRSALRKLEF
jgi:hypothetical protein